MSFHAGQTFTFGETPSATKWNYLWENDYALADGSGISAGAITTAKLAAAAVTSSKIDFTTFPASASFSDPDVSGGANGVTVLSDTYGFVIGQEYLIIHKNLWAGSSDGGIWTLNMSVNGVGIASSRLSGVTSVQYPSISMAIYTAAATASYTVAVTANRATGSGTVTVEQPRVLIIPLAN